MKTLLVTILFVLSSVYSFSQSSQQWITKFNGTGNSFDASNKSKVDRFGNIYVSGYSNGPNGNIDFCLLKYNSSGTLLWSRTYDGPNHLTDDSYAMTIDDAGNIFLGGRSDSNLASGMLTIKYSSSGELLWMVDFGGLLITDSNGNLYICGESVDSQNNYHQSLRKYSSSGTLVWENINSTERAYALDITLDQSGNIILTGELARDENADIGTWKYNSTGNLLWERSYQFAPKAVYRGVFVKSDAIGNIYVAGESNSSGLSENDFVTLKYNLSGEQQWAAIYHGAASWRESVRGLIIDAERNIYITGESGDDFTTMKYNNNGEQQWCAIYNGEANDRDEVYGIAVDAASNVYVTGWSSAPDNMDCVTIKYNTYGVQQWKQIYRNPLQGTNCTNSILVDSSNSVYVSGFSEGNGSAADILLIKYSQTTGLDPISTQLPVKYSLAQNYPNPFNPNTTIEFTLPENTFATLKIFDMIGREMYTLINENMVRGSYRYNFNGLYLASGTYFYKLQTAGFTETKKMVLVK
ncbi:MAG: SBBP repeat-containing protein [Bacteroidetes bacterium]|nr:SBBP repeat-containing protein [Bacteroidota bacterium]